MSDNPFRKLWCATLTAAIKDATGPRPARGNALNDWKTARRYIGSRDFKEVCTLAGFDPDWVEGKVRARMAA